MRRKSTPPLPSRRQDLPAGLQKRLVSVEQSCFILGIGRTNFYSLVAAKKIGVVKVGRRTLVPVEQLDQFVAALTRPATTMNDATAGDAR
ncbi:excisionase family DNA-binding protein [Methylobacterium sp. R2-1]|uniref:excisionase family DNA-binding protein n=1 Tax=Methylobacterium sp. R2-1 TaxID=2587064 RepID=UPI00161E402A|nr:excisionase family DNA binding protein [Methylobacterium sp. R2-1]